MNMNHARFEDEYDELVSDRAKLRQVGVAPTPREP
ncbi:hypothetical protein BH09VER1_BH09VER1_39070 [soil metagenome]